MRAAGGHVRVGRLDRGEQGADPEGDVLGSSPRRQLQRVRGR